MLDVPFSLGLMLIKLGCNLIKSRKEYIAYSHVNRIWNRLWERDFDEPIPECDPRAALHNTNIFHSSSFCAHI